VEHNDVRVDASQAALNWPTRIVMLIGGLMVAIAMSAITPVLPKIEAALAVTANDKLLVKMLVPIVGVTMVIGAPLTGWLVDRFGLRRILLIHCTLYAVGGTAGLYLNEIMPLLASRLLVGLGASGLATISMTLINTRLEGNERARWMGYHIATAMFGALIVQPTVGLLGEIGWRWPFLAYAASVIVACAALAGLQEPPLRTPETAQATRGSGNPLKWFPLWFLPFALVMGTVTYLPNVYLPYVVRDVGVTSPAVISTVMLADALLGATIAMLFGRSQRYISSNTAFVISFGCAGTGMVIVGLASGFAGIVAGMLVFGLGLGWFVPNLMFALSRRVTQLQQGRAVGIVKSAHYLASPLAVVAVEPISRAYGSSAVLLASGLLSFVMVATFLLLRARPGTSLAAPVMSGT
jgi:predicted MFS family arabinose efflux permease